MSLQANFEDLKNQQPGIRARDAANELGVTEAEIVEAQVGQSATRLRPEWKEILLACRDLGEVMALTRNEAVVLEIDGQFIDLSFDGMIGLGLEPGFDLRIFLFAWKYGFAVEKDSPRGRMRSLQFFDAAGVAVFKIWLRSASSVAVYDLIVEKFGTTDEPPIEVKELEKPASKGPDDIDQHEFQKAWRELKDTHDFFPMLRTFKLPRLAALRCGPEEYVEQVPVRTLQALLDELTTRDLEIMFFVGSRGMIEIFTGRIHTTRHSDTWWNVLDKGMNLHINHTKLKEAWVVQKPTVDGIVTSLEVFDHDENLVLSVFGARKPGDPELQGWRDVLASI